MRNQYIEIINDKNKFSRISWGAVFAGALTALVVLFLLNLLGFGIGLTTIDPMTENNPFDGLGTGTIVWWAIANVAALFIGGMVAGRMSGLPSNSDGGLHGFLAWALYTLLSIFFVTSTIGSIFNGLANTTQAIFSDSTGKNIAQELKSAQDKGQDDTTFSLDQLKREAFQLINKAEKYNILPNDASEEVRSTLNQTQRESQQFLNDLNLDENIDEFFNELTVDLDENGDLSISAGSADNLLNREKIKDYLAQNTELSEAEINGVIEKWDRKINKAVDKAEQYYAEVKREAIEAADKTADAVGKFSIIAFFLLLLGAGAAFGGGATGSPILTVDEEHREDMMEDSQS
ncbi:TIGR04086 family membrane protein [Aequorivita lipolytica]|uniref:CAP-Gly protein n=1 Tax=Aequorivita lipolytica TaxID=153267 RepID=A0A5C6YMM9_9FLAO|nr:TIGR04086 family membrane protein [Aequorivita lipolytica]TXD68294.1 hypothetical protein ESV24_12570 [Aequorivita lipolytica]SRX53436.1 hypothetical protein AEQU2_02667 [Aequorivita lipolytica]